MYIYVYVHMYIYAHVFLGGGRGRGRGRGGWTRGGGDGGRENFFRNNLNGNGVVTSAFNFRGGRGGGHRGGGHSDMQGSRMPPSGLENRKFSPLTGSAFMVRTITTTQPFSLTRRVPNRLATDPLGIRDSQWDSRGTTTERGAGRSTV